MPHLIRTARTRASHADTLARRGGSLAFRAHLTRCGFAALFLVSGCASDSITSPLASTPCVAEPGCRPSPGEPLDLSVLAALDDARERLVPALDNAATRTSLDGVLLQLEEQLKANRTADARVRLAAAYGQLDRTRIALPGSDPMDLPDMSAIRLALVPVANALGVQPTF
jgi:hypothetical protein